LGFLKFALVLTLIVIMLGAWTRLKDAGLGCPDWPFCYGHITVPVSEQSLVRVQERFPDHVVEPEKAWPEMIHRYFASAIGFCILLVAAFMWRRRQEQGMPWRHGLALLVLVSVQGAFGAWTVTMKLYPPVVTGHLLLGFATLSMLFLLYLRTANAYPATGQRVPTWLPKLLAITIAALIAQIALGGWTAANYAATVCTELPICQAGWREVWTPAEAFRLFRPDDANYEFAPHLDAAAKVTIHATHRIGAFVVTAIMLLLIAALMTKTQHTRYRAFAGLLAFGLLVQIILGVVNVVADLPLWNAVAHNVWAAVLLQMLVALAFALKQESSWRKLQ
jgi:cytochrome c oxidase assembly protein subunit 15